MKKIKTIHGVAVVTMLIAVLFLTKCTKDQNADRGRSASAKTLAATNSSLAVQATSFVHPGILNTQASLDYIAAQVNNNTDADRVAAYNLVTAYCDSHNPSGNYKATIQVASRAGTDDETSFKGDALLSYALALRWAKTGNAAYATTVKNILDGWAAKFQGIQVVGDSPNQYQGSLEASWATPTFCAAAEIIKYYKCSNGQTGGWTTAEDTQFKSFINILKNNYINNTPAYDNNWNVSQGYAKMAIGIFLDNQDVYNSGLTIIQTELPKVIASDGSMDGEICASHDDYTHYQYSLTGFTYAANLAVMQFGDLSIYNGSNSRLLAGYTYQYKLIKGSVTPPCTIKSGQNVTSPIWPGIEIADRRYHTTETTYIRNLRAPYGLPGNDLGFLGWTTYTHHNVNL